MVHAVGPQRWMLFVDGENLAIQGGKAGRKAGYRIVEGANSRDGVFLWPPRGGVTCLMNSTDWPSEIRCNPLRSFYFTAMQGDDPTIAKVTEMIWSAGFQPRVFKKRNGKSKGVEISLATEILGNAYKDNYDVAVLMAGDGDYVPMVEEVKRQGKILYVAFFAGAEQGVSDELRLASDWLVPIGTTYFDNFGK